MEMMEHIKVHHSLWHLYTLKFDERVRRYNKQSCGTVCVTFIGGSSCYLYPVDMNHP